MSAVVEAREPSARYQSAAQPPLLQHFESAAIAPAGVTRLRNLILALAMRGKLVRQDPRDEPASILVSTITTQRSKEERTRRLDNSAPVPPPDEEFPLDLPLGWQWVRMGSVFSLEYGAALPEKLREPGAIPVYGSNGIVGRHTRSLVDQASLVVGRKGSVGAINITDGPSWPIDTAYFVVPPMGVDLRFAYWLFRSRNLARHDKATAIPGINRNDVYAELIALPPGAEQSRIVARVDELMRLCDALEAKGRLEAEQHSRLLGTLLGTLTDSTTPEELAANWQRVVAHFDLVLDRPEAVDGLEQTILQLGLRGLLTPIRNSESPSTAGGPLDPFSWPTVRLGDVLEDLRYGTSAKCSYGRAGTPVLRIPNLRDGGIDVADLKFGDLDAREVESLRLEPGDLLIIRSNGSASLVGAAALVSSELTGFAFAGYLVRARLDKTKAAPHFIALIMKTQEIRRQIEAPIRTTSGVKNINSRELARLSFTLPPLEVQDSIVARVTELRHLCADLRQRLAAARATQSHLADALVESALA